jgi:hypothetical protein
MLHLKHIERLHQLHQRIKAENTGSPTTVAKQLCTSRRNIYFLIGKLKFYGAKISYSRKRKTFYYKEDDFDIKMNVKIEVIRKGVAKKIYGGSTFFKKNASVLTTYTEQR